MTKRKNISKNLLLLVINTLDIGGAPRQITYLANGLIHKGFSVKIFCYDNKPNFYELSKEIEIINGNFGSRRHGFFRPKSIIYKLYSRISIILFLFSTIVKYRPNLLISFISDVSFDSLVAAKLTNKKIIVSERGDPISRNRMRKLLSKWTYSNASLTIFQSNEARNYFPKSKRTNVIGNFYPNIKANSLKRVNHKLISVSSLTKSKNLKHSIIAFSFVVKRFPWLKYEIFGEGSEKSYLNQLINSLGLTNSVTINDSTNDILDELRNFTIILSTSYSEGIPNNLIEAMACGLVVVAYDWSPGNGKDIISNGYNGFLIPANRIDLIVSCIEKLIIDDDHYESLSNASTKFINANANNQLILRSWKSSINKILLD